MLKLGIIRYKAVEEQPRHYQTSYGREGCIYYLDKKELQGGSLANITVDNFGYMTFIFDFYYVMGKSQRIYTMKEETQFYA
jgi:hypothetical protein